MRSISLQKPMVQGRQYDDWVVGSRDSGSWETKYGGSENMMAVIESALGMSGPLHGFTLFERGVGKGWQLSTRRKGENGWDVKMVPEDHAQALLALLSDYMPQAAEPTGLRVALDANVAAWDELTAALAAR